jgi:hypothetical protein
MLLLCQRVLADKAFTNGQETSVSVCTSILYFWSFGAQQEAEVGLMDLWAGPECSSRGTADLLCG